MAKVQLDLERVAQQVGLPTHQVAQTVALLEDGNTIPFVTRYRKDQTGGLNEEQIERIQSSLEKQRQLEERKEAILRSVKSQGKLSPELAQQIEKATSTKQLEDVYLPYRPKKQTLATLARERGLAPLAEEILAADASCADREVRAAAFVNAECQVSTAADALQGAGHIIAEIFSERVGIRQRMRKSFRRMGRLVSTKSEGDSDQDKRFPDYFDFSQPISKLPPHRILAINRGERAKVLRVKVDVDMRAIEREAINLLVKPDHVHAEFLQACVRDALMRLIVPSLEREVRRELTEKAEAHAVEVFARNLRKLLLQPPICGRRVLAIDPGFKSGCKVAAIDEFGSVLHHDLVYLVGSEERKRKSRARMAELLCQHKIDLVAIGNGTGCREAEELVSELIGDGVDRGNISYLVVNEAGASVYSTSALGREEFPDCDATQRSAISIGRRVQDPLSELVKIDPASIGVGLYQHDAKAKHLQGSLDGVVRSCVNYVGVDLNTASAALLRHVSGLNQLTARRLFEQRLAHGPFQNREQLKEVSGLGEATFVQSVGFLKIENGTNPLDATWIHPESYEVATRVLHQLGFTPEDLRNRESLHRLAHETKELQPEVLARELNIGEWLLKDLIAALVRPGRDPREDLPPPVFRKGVVKLEDLAEGMELTGTVLNVVDFGAFVDIGLSDSGLVHISKMSTQFVRDPHDVVSVGDQVKVWVAGVDKSRRRVSLSMIQPGSEVPPPTRPKKENKKPPAARPSFSKRRTPGPSTQGSRRPTPKKPKPRPRPKTPITKAMKEGREPMRTFGQLLQFHQKQTDEQDVERTKRPKASKGKRASGPSTASRGADEEKVPQTKAPELELPEGKITDGNASDETAPKIVTPEPQIPSVDPPPGGEGMSSEEATHSSSP